MIHLIGAICLCIISVRCCRQAYLIYAEEKTSVARAVAVLYAAIGAGSVIYAYFAVVKFIGS